MRSWFAFVAMCVGLVACTSNDADDEGGGGGCADIAGNYDVTVSRVSGDCPASDKGSTKASITIGSDSTGLYVLLPGVDGGCPGTLDAATCRFQAQCKITDKDRPAVTLVTYNLDYTFAGKTLTGSLVGGAAAGVLAADECTSTVKHDGTRL